MTTQEKREMYELMRLQLTELFRDERHALANLCNTAACLFDAMPHVNWAGFYLMHNGELLLGPFQGKVACMHIQLGKGVCGTAAQSGQVQVVPNVHEFPGHIACDSASNSEIVLPMYDGERLLGVLDIDSEIPERFDEEDKQGLSAIVSLLETGCDWSKIGYTGR